ncbi:hypothetical protein OPKNFCMD_6701 [Methylobacterium crusticola]|uniref:Uncharacterized protein n=1 Tax=Methylobacterium crusticola TaxID=1697972 RepID=A0ABQ4R864_9HYPH|nr:hypothetical protein [Methylobacterium crusticola]GJD53922.1 hypothetical protein OPKNFCMD_6701 [Methylobacterium crusticola]
MSINERLATEALTLATRAFRSSERDLSSYEADRLRELVDGLVAEGEENHPTAVAIRALVQAGYRPCYAVVQGVETLWIQGEQ